MIDGLKGRDSRPEARGIEPYYLGPTRWSRGRKDWEGCLPVCNEVSQTAMETLGSPHHSAHCWRSSQCQEDGAAYACAVKDVAVDLANQFCHLA